MVKCKIGQVTDVNKCPDGMFSRDGLLKSVGPADSIEFKFKGALFENVIDASGMCVIPGQYY